MWLRRAAPILVLLAACEEGGDATCVVQQESYRVSVAVSMQEPAKSANEGSVAQAAVVESGRVLASVMEDHSIIACDDGLWSLQSPGRDLISNLPVYVDAAGFTLNVESTFYPALEIPYLWLQVVLDENNNGRCDDGEPMGGAPIERLAQTSVALELTRGPCLLKI